MKLSILDQTPVSKLYTPQEGIENSVEIARLAEKLGYERYWMAEHHNTPEYASAAPELLLAYIAGQTETIRLGTGGIMLMHYSPYKLAEVVNTLSALAPDRFDFGAGRAPGTDQLGTLALASPGSLDRTDQYQKLEQILALSRNDREDEALDDILRSVRAMPQDVAPIAPYLLGSSGQSAAVAGRMGIGYSFAQFFMLNAINKSIFDTYRQTFTETHYQKEPHIIVAYLVTVAESEEEAEYQARPIDIQRLYQNSGRAMPMMLPEEAASFQLSDKEEEAIQINRAIHLVGTADMVLQKIKEDQDLYGFDEAMICTINPTQDQRLKTYRLLAEAKDKY